MYTSNKVANTLQRFIYAPQEVIGLRDHKIARIASGNQHTLALTQSGQVLSFGRTTYGRLGRLQEDFKSNVAQENPGFVDGLSGVDVESISAGERLLFQPYHLYPL